jgi:hypothetical protein
VINFKFFLINLIIQKKRPWILVAVKIFKKKYFNCKTFFVIMADRNRNLDPQQKDVNLDKDKNLGMAGQQVHTQGQGLGQRQERDKDRDKDINQDINKNIPSQQSQAQQLGQQKGQQGFDQPKKV